MRLDTSELAAVRVRIRTANIEWEQARETHVSAALTDTCMCKRALCVWVCLCMCTHVCMRARVFVHVYTP